MPVAQQNSKISVTDLGDELMLYNTDDECVHVLNATARDVWNLCDGTRGIEAIYENMLKKYEDVDQSELQDDITNLLDDFKQKKLIIIV